MKKELQFYGTIMLRQTLLIAALTLGLIVGLRWTNNGDNLFGTYASMYALFVMLFPFVFSISQRGYLDLALSFGAKRMYCFWAAELTYFVFLAAMVGMAKLVSIFSAGIPNMRQGAMYVGPEQAAIMLLMGFILIQLGFLAANILDQKRRSMLLVILILGVMGGVFGLAFMLLSTHEISDPAKVGSLLYLSFENPLWCGIMAGMAVLGVVLAYFVRRKFRKAVYCG